MRARDKAIKAEAVALWREIYHEDPPARIDGPAPRVDAEPAPADGLRSAEYAAPAPRRDELAKANRL